MFFPMSEGLLQISNLFMACLSEVRVFVWLVGFAFFVWEKKDDLWKEDKEG